MLARRSTERVRRADGSVEHYAVEKTGAHRLVRVSRSGGVVLRYTGKRCSERLLRAEMPDGAVYHFEGDKGAERKARLAGPDGVVWFYQGEPGAERVVRAVLPSGRVPHAVDTTHTKSLLSMSASTQRPQYSMYVVIYSGLIETSTKTQ